jgi:SAM-dependent methyltransferase
MAKTEACPMTAGTPLLYDDLAGWWPLLSPPAEYEDEAADLLPRLPKTRGSQPATLLELGAGGGSLAFHLKRHFRLTLTDRAPAMLAVSRALNPECEHQLGDMLSLRLGRQFDVVLIHDAIMYATEPAAVQATLWTAAIHCRPGGTVAVLPDFVRETFLPRTDRGGHDAVDGRGLRYLEWVWDPDPTDDTYIADYAFLLRAKDGSVTVAHDRHVEGLFARALWLQWFSEAGVPASCSLDPWGREVFIGTRRGPGAEDGGNRGKYTGGHGPRETEKHLPGAVGQSDE